MSRSDLPLFILFLSIISHHPLVGAIFAHILNGCITQVIAGLDLLKPSKSQHMWYYLTWIPGRLIYQGKFRQDKNVVITQAEVINPLCSCLEEESFN